MQGGFFMGIIKRFKEQERGVFAGLSTHFPILLINRLCITRIDSQARGVFFFFVSRMSQV
jgi:hypothetical protein